MLNNKLKTVDLKFFQKYPNVGDQFCLAVANRYFSQNVVVHDTSRLSKPNLILTGSILQCSDASSHVCGAGFISSKSKLRDHPNSISCVRGPLSASLLENQGVKAPAIFADPGILAPELFPEKESITSEIGIIPHYVDNQLPWIKRCRDMGVRIIDVLSPLEVFFAELQKCHVILSSSLHGIILAHSYKKPALWIELSDNVYGEGFKFYDYYQSIGVRQENVVRHRISEGNDPFEIAKIATTGDHSNMLPLLKQAMSDTLKELKKKQQYALIRNTYSKVRSLIGI